MDSAAPGTWALNETVATINLTGRTNVWLAFQQKEFNDSDDPIPASFVGHTNADGVAMSADGTNWFAVVSLTGAASAGSYSQTLIRLDGIAASNAIAFNGNFQIKFQQYGRYSVPSSGFAFDDISVYSPSGAMQFVTSAYTAYENAGIVTIRVDRTQSADGAVSVGYSSADGTAMAGTHYTSATGVLSFANAQTSATFTVTLTNNNLPSPTRTFSVYLRDYSLCQPGTPVSAVVSIQDQEAQTLLLETFDAGLPSGWTVRTNAATNAFWRFDNPDGRANRTGGSGTFAIADSDNAGSINMDTELLTRSVSLTNQCTAFLEFKNDFYAFSTEIADVDLSTNGTAGPWTNLWCQQNSSLFGQQTILLSLPGTAPCTNVMIRFHYYNANYEWWWQVDDVAIFGEVDANTNSLPDWWESRYFPSVTNLNGSVDADGDGLSNWQEFIAGTDPTRSNSQLQIEGFAATNRTLSFESVIGRTYWLLYRTNLLTGAWTRNGSGSPGSGGTLTLHDGASLSNNFYCIEVSRP